SDVLQAVLRAEADAGATYRDQVEDLWRAQRSRIEVFEVPVDIPGSRWTIGADLSHRNTMLDEIGRIVRQWTSTDSDAYWRDVKPTTKTDIEKYDLFRELEPDEPWLDQ